MKEKTKPELYGEAINAVKEEGMSLRKTVAKFGVSLTSLRRRMNGEVEIDAKNGSTPILTKDEEKGIIISIIERTNRGICFKKRELKRLIRNVVQKSCHY